MSIKLDQACINRLSVNVTETPNVNYDFYVNGTAAVSSTFNLASQTASAAVVTDASKNLSTRAILNNTSVSALNWNSDGGNTHADNLRFMTVNTLAYWNGAYSGTTSNLEYYKDGKFGTMAKETAADYAKLASPVLTGTPTAPTAADGTNTTQIATTAFVMSQFKYNDAMIYKGVVNANSDLPTTHYQGWTYRVATAGTYAGIVCEIGDMIICNTDGTSANNAHWNVIQTNIDGAVIGPAAVSSGRDNHVPRFDGETGKLLQSSGVIIDDNNNVTIPGTALKVTAEAGAKYILIGNQNSQGVDCPVVLQGVNGSLYIGNGTDWSSNTGGTLSTAIYMSKDRKVGIGTTSPFNTLDVNGTGRFQSELTLYRSSTTAQNYPARINFSVYDSTLAQTNNGYIAYYNDHTTTYNGTLVVSSGGTTLVGAGESAATLYSTLGTTYNSENLFLTADTGVYVYAYADTAANRIGFTVNTSGHILPQKAEGANNNQQNLGASNNKWANVYATTFNGDLTGNVTGNVSGSSGSCTGNAATATAIQTAGTTAQFYRGDNSWSNILKQTAAAALGIDTNSKIGTAIKDLHFSLGYGSGTASDSGNAGGITFGTDTASYGGIYWQTSGGYGSRLHFATTNDFANGAYTRMIITHDGKIGIGTLSPDTLLTVNGNAKATKFIGALQGNADTATSSTKAGVAGIWLYPENNNEINFGGTNTGTIMYFGYRAKDSREIPTKFVFGSSTGTADLQAKTVYLGSGTSSYISSTQYTGNAASATKVAAKLAATTKTYLLGTSTAITTTAANVDLIGDTGIYATTTSGELSTVRHSWNISGTEKVYSTWNTADSSLDFIFV